MSSLSERLTRGPASRPEQVDHARRLVADWQLLADLAFADLTLWVPLKTGAWWCVAQVRPLTAPTSRPEDLVGSEVGGVDAEPFVVAHREGAAGHRGRAGLVGGRSAAARGDPGPARRRRRRRPGQGHQPGGDPVALDPRADLPRHRRRPLPDGLGRHLPAGEGPRRRDGPARGGRPGAAGRAGPRRLRQPERAVGLPAGGARRRPRRRATWPR